MQAVPGGEGKLDVRLVGEDTVLRLKQLHAECLPQDALPPDVLPCDVDGEEDGGCAGEGASSAAPQQP